MSRQRVVIVGAGPAGLTAAYKLLEDGGSKNYKVIVLEADKQVGGISKTINYKGNRMDLGGHRFFTKDPEVKAFWNKILPMKQRPRVSHIYCNRAFFDYPPKINFETAKKMGWKQITVVGLSYLKSFFFKKDERSLEDFYINRFGKKLYQMFFRDYTEKLWGVPPSKISAEWGAQRVKGLSITAVLKNFFIPKARKETSLIEQFEYPKYGPGQMYEKMAKDIVKMGGEIITNAKVVNISLCEKKVTTIWYKKDGKKKRISIDWLISSMPIKDLIHDMGINVPKRVRTIAEKLPYRDFRTIGILAKKTKSKLPDSWIYIQEPGVKMGRIQIFNNWSPDMVKDKKNTWMGLEYFCNKNDEIDKMTDAEFYKLASEELCKIGLVVKKSDIIDYHCERVSKAYPAYFGNYKNFPTVRKFLDDIPNLYLVGRNGQHRYNNMDHSILTAFEAVKNIKGDKKSKDNVWAVNTDKEYHEEDVKNALKQKNRFISWIVRNKKPLIVFGIYATISLIAVLFHEPWEDEAQAWLTARDCTPTELIGRMSIEGHFLPWYLVLMPFAKLGFAFKTINIVSWLITGCAAWLMLKKLPCKFYKRALFIFTLPMLYLFPDISRCYCLIPLATILAIMFYKNRFEKPIPYLCSIVLMANTHIFCLMFALIMGLEYLLDWLRIYRNLNTKQNRKILIGIIGAVILCILSILPLFGSVGSNAQSGVTITSEPFTMAKFLGIVYDYLGMGFWCIPITITIILSTLFLVSCAAEQPMTFLKIAAALLWQLLIINFLYATLLPSRATVAIFIVLFFMMCKRWRQQKKLSAKTQMVQAIIAKTGLILILLYLVFKTGAMSYSILCCIFLGIFLIPIWLKKLHGFEIKNLNQKMLKIASGGLLLCSIIAGFIAFSKEIALPFSDAEVTAKYISDNLENDALFISLNENTSFITTPIIAHLLDNKNNHARFYDLANQRYYTYSNNNSSITDDKFDLVSFIKNFKNNINSNSLIYYIEPYPAQPNELANVLNDIIEKEVDLKTNGTLAKIYDSVDYNTNIDYDFHSCYEYYRIYRVDISKKL